MKKNKFIKSTLILVLGGFITKILGMLIKIVTTRALGTEGIGLYMLITPTFMLLITLSQLGLPVAISKLVAEDNRNNKNLVFSIIPVTIIINIVIIIIMLIFSKYIATNLLHDKRCYYALICTGLVLPFISISSILRGYFFGKEKMIPHVVSNITEDLVRLIIIAVGVKLFNKIEYAVAFIVISNIFSELTSIFVLFFFLPKKFNIKKTDFKLHLNNAKDILEISIPTTGSRLIGSISYFFEPIIITFVLIKIGYSNSFIINEYGIINGYVMPLLLLPSFFTMAISQALIPEVSKLYFRKKYKETYKKIKEAIFFSLLIGIPATIIFEIFPEQLLKFIYNTNEGVTYLKVLAPICILHYIQSPLTSAMQAMNKSVSAMNATIIGSIIKVILLFSLSYLHIGMWGLIIATSINIIYVTLHHIKHIKRTC